MKKYYVCIDIGGTSIKYGLMNENTNLLFKSSIATEAQQGGPQILKKVIKIIEEFQKEYCICGICISTAGVVDMQKGEIIYSASLIPNYTGTKIKKVLEEKFNIPCEVENDVNCAGLAELISGSAKGCLQVLCLTVGTGIGGCIIVDGEIMHGASHCAGEFGYMNMFGSNFQTLAATSFLTEKVASLKKDKCSNWDGQRIFEEAKKGDPICIKEIQKMVDMLAYGIANICYVTNPQVVVLGGGIMEQEDYLSDMINESVSKYLMPNIANKTSIKFAKHKNAAGMIGAYYHFKKMHCKIF